MPGRAVAMAGRLGQLAARLMLARYLIVSIVSLWADTALFLALSRWVMPASWAAFVGYAAGMAVHWVLSVRFVFTDSGQRPSHVQRASFVLSGLIGLAITVGLVYALGAIGTPLLLAKGVAVLVSFTAVYLVRKYVVFARR
ncbi:GtrA family protein [Sphingobium yanoikuyae]|uniref:GtrA family protein n=1 Tax=Sphingobium yanoikuyae TaxID=13690 RepID=UPI002FD965FF